MKAHENIVLPDNIKEEIKNNVRILKGLLVNEPDFLGSLICLIVEYSIFKFATLVNGFFNHCFLVQLNI